MKSPPLILVSPNIEKKGEEFGDLSISVSETYQNALLRAGAMPLAMPATVSREMIAQCVDRCDGVLLTGGEDIEPGIYGNGLSQALRKTVTLTADAGARDFRELVLVDEVFRQRKPLLAICRGHQVVNVALGGGLIVDIATQMPNAMNHRRMQHRSQIVHEVQLTDASLLTRITGKKILGVNSTHHQAVGRVAPPLAVAGLSSDGVVEALQLKEPDMLPFFLTVQFHPERLANRYPEHQAIFDAFTQVCAGCIPILPPARSPAFTRRKASLQPSVQPTSKVKRRQRRAQGVRALNRN